MTLSELRSQIPDFGRDIRLNLESVLTPEGAPGLTPNQIWLVALACAYSIGHVELATAITEESLDFVDDQGRQAAKSAAAIMGMNNIYYRSTHLLEDAEIKKLPARLRMTVIGKPGVAKVDFELMCFAVSAIAGCGACLQSHLHEVRAGGLSTEGAQSALRIASVIRAAQVSLRIAGM